MCKCGGACITCRHKMAFPPNFPGTAQAQAATVRTRPQGVNPGPRTTKALTKPYQADQGDNWRKINRTLAVPKSTGDSVSPIRWGHLIASKSGSGVQVADRRYYPTPGGRLFHNGQHAPTPKRRAGAPLDQRSYNYAPIKESAVVALAQKRAAARAAAVARVRGR